MEDLEGAVRRDFRLDLLEAGDEARITNELRDNRMVRMSSVQRMGDYDLRLQTPDHDRNLRACLGRVLDSAIRETQVFAHCDAHHFRRFRSLLRAQLRRAAAGQLSGGEVENSSGPPERMCADESAATNKLDVVGVGGDGEDVDLRHAENLLVPQSVDRIQLRRSL